LVYRAEALLDNPPEQDARGARDVIAVEKVMTMLVERDDALRRAREDLAGAHSIAASWEAEVASARAQLQQDCAALEGARAWQSQAEENAKKAEGLRTVLASKAAALTAAEEQLRQEGAARQQAETQLQQDLAALAEARAALERERLVREEALGWLQQERTALEGAQAALKQREDEVSRLNGELVQINISHEDLRQSLEEQEATVHDLQRQAEDSRKSLEGEKKQVEGEFTFVCFFARRFVFRGFALNFVFICSWLSGLRTALGNTTTQAEAVQVAYNSSQQELEELRAAALEICQEVEEGEAKAESSLASRLRALGGHVS
jgi:chromosome segregation ATPase